MTEAASALAAAQAREAELVAALREVEDWLRYEVPIPTPRATTILGIVQRALPALLPKDEA